MNENEFLKEIPHYVMEKDGGSIRQVQALKIRHVIPNPRGCELHFYDERVVPIQVSAEFAEDFSIEPDDYCIWHLGGKISIADGQHFESHFLSEAEFVKRQHGYFKTLRFVAGGLFSSWRELPDHVEHVRRHFKPLADAAFFMVVCVLAPLVFVAYPLIAWGYMRHLRDSETARLEWIRRMVADR